MQSKLDSSLIQLDPSDTLNFKPSHTSKASTSLLIKNLSENTIVFRVRVSAPKEFIVTPVNGVISASNNVNINITFVASADRKNAGQKFSIECCQAHDVSLADWKGKIVQFKLTTRFEVEEIKEKEKEKEKGKEWENDREGDKERDRERERERERDNEESFNEFASFAYSDIPRDEKKSGGLEEEKKEITALNSEISAEIRKLHAMIEDANHKLRFNKDIDLISQEIGGKYAFTHCVFMFLIGILVGYYVLA